MLILEAYRCGDISCEGDGTMLIIILWFGLMAFMFLGLVVVCIVEGVRKS